MKVSNAAKLCLEYHKSHSKENTGDIVKCCVWH
jgi:hypothetical protein